MTKWPSKKQLDRVLKRLEKKPVSQMLPRDANAVDKIKYQICEQFVIYRRNTKISQKALAKKIGIDEALMSKVLHYYIGEFTIDRLIRFLAELHPGVEVKIDVA